MDTTKLEILIRKSVQKVQNVSTQFKRYLHSKIDWSNRLIIIKGARGVGKTTLLLQHIKAVHGITEEVLYVSLDDIWFAENRLVDLAEQFSNLGGKYLFLDEIHKYNNWSQEIKNIYDDYPDLKLVLTGSSALHIFSGKGDLSRRALVYELNELSLREYIRLWEGIDFPPYNLENILENRLKISTDISRQIKPVKVLKNYFNHGCYPYLIEDPANYPFRLQNALNTTLETDLPAILNIDYGSVIKLKKLLYVIATSAPFKPNITDLSQKIGVARDTLLRYLYHLSEAHLIYLLHSEKRGISYLNKPDKVYLYNTNLTEAITGNRGEIGALRETFFLNQVSNIADVKMHTQTDFLVNNQLGFEIGGKNKTGKQIQGLSQAFIVADDIESGFKQKIPLWLFGFLY